MPGPPAPAATAARRRRRRRRRRRQRRPGNANGTGGKRGDGGTGGTGGKGGASGSGTAGTGGTGGTAGAGGSAGTGSTGGGGGNGGNGGAGGAGGTGVTASPRGSSESHRGSIPGGVGNPDAPGTPRTGNEIADTGPTRGPGVLHLPAGPAAFGHQAAVRPATKFTWELHRQNDRQAGVDDMQNGSASRIDSLHLRCGEPHTRGIGGDP